MKLPNMPSHPNLNELLKNLGAGTVSNVPGVTPVPAVDITKPVVDVTTHSPVADPNATESTVAQSKGNGPHFTTSIPARVSKEVANLNFTKRKKIPVSNLDLVFLSYDEPNCEENWTDLKGKAPWAQRVHGVKGFDTAHKRCAELAKTDHFITVDGDNIVYPEFFNIDVDIVDPKFTFSCNSRNVVNGLCYGNGGIKIWNRESVLSMRTHENALNDSERVDFCWSSTYMQLNNVYSDTVINCTPFQAFRAGFREGVKMLLNRGKKVENNRIKEDIYQKNYNRCLTWASIGADVENGLWSIYGTRLGLYLNTQKDFDMFKVSDYDWFKEFWTKVSESVESKGLVESIKELGLPLRALGLEVPDFIDADGSRLFKQLYEAPKKLSNPMITEAEVANAFV